MNRFVFTFLFDKHFWTCRHFRFQKAIWQEFMLVMSLFWCPYVSLNNGTSTVITPLIGNLGIIDVWASITVCPQEPILSPALFSPVHTWRFIHMVKVSNIKVKLSQSIRQRNAQLSQRYNSVSNPKQNLYTLIQNSPFFFFLSKHNHGYLSFCLILLIEEILLFPSKYFKAGHILQEDVTEQHGASPLFTWRCFLLAWYPPFPVLICCLGHVADHSINRKDTWKII